MSPVPKDPLLLSGVRTTIPFGRVDKSRPLQIASLVNLKSEIQISDAEGARMIVYIL